MMVGAAVAGAIAGSAVSATVTIVHGILPVVDVSPTKMVKIYAFMFVNIELKVIYKHIEDVNRRDDQIHISNIHIWKSNKTLIFSRVNRVRCVYMEHVSIS